LQKRRKGKPAKNAATEVKSDNGSSYNSTELDVAPKANRERIKVMLKLREEDSSDEKIAAKPKVSVVSKSCATKDDDAESSKK
jgi:hypothetical protein